MKTNSQVSSSFITYMDNAATSWPKPPEVFEAIVEAMKNAGNAGRSGHRMAVAAARIVYEAREAVATLLGVSDPMRVVFGPNATWALNLVLRGLLKSGDRVVTTSIEHNSVMRPLRALEREGIILDIAQCDEQGVANANSILRLVRSNTRCVVMCHVSNVTGALQPVTEVAARLQNTETLLVVDAAQSAGVVPIDVTGEGLDIVVFSGHKFLCGPMGTGGLVFGPSCDASLIDPLVRGGTGSHSEFEEQPDFLPDRFESGTVNVIGLAGLAAGVRFVLQKGVENIRSGEQVLLERLINGLASLEGTKVLGPLDLANRVGTVSLTFDKWSVSEIARRLDEDFGILCRAGLHCAPACHRTIGTFPSGTLRLSLGPLSTISDVEHTLSALTNIVKQR